jgi:hypothetical protein
MIHDLELSLLLKDDETIDNFKKIHWHSNLFANYFLVYEGNEINVSVSDSLKHTVSRSGGRASRYGHFEVKLNGNLCTVAIGDNSYINPVFYERSKAKISFVAQIRKSDLGKMKKIYNDFGHRIYPIPLPLHFNAKEISKGDKTYQNKEKKYLSNMSFSLRGREHRMPWVMFAKKHHKKFFTGSLPENEYLDFCINDQVWGVSLKGHGLGRKCFRETEFMCLGVPMALNYIPVYPFDFEPGIHFHLLRKRWNLLDLEKIDHKPYAKISKELGEKYMRQKGYLDLMMRCIKQKEYNPLLGDK